MTINWKPVLDYMPPSEKLNSLRMRLTYREGFNSDDEFWFMLCEGNQNGEPFKARASEIKRFHPNWYLFANIDSAP